MSETTGKVGRPMLSKKKKKGKFISTRVSPAEYQEIVQAAKESGIRKTKWVRTKLLAAARRA
jgi:predicted HicB family RNase H-like nuclease